MRALIYHPSNPIVDRLKTELTRANEFIRFIETVDYKRALELFVIHEPKIIILDIDQPNGHGSEFLQNLKNHLSDIKVVSLSNHPCTKIILLNFQNAEFENE